MWWFPKMGVPLNHPFIDGIFHKINHPFGVPPILGNLRSSDTSTQARLRLLWLRHLRQMASRQQLGTWQPLVAAVTCFGWWYVSTPLKNMKVIWDEYSQHMENKTCSKPPTVLDVGPWHGQKRDTWTARMKHTRQSFKGKLPSKLMSTVNPGTLLTLRLLMLWGYHFNSIWHHQFEGIP